RGGPGARGGAATGRAERIVQWLPPFGPTNVKVLYQHTGPISAVVMTEDATTAFVATTAAGTGELFAVRFAEPTKRMTILRQRGWTPGFAGGGRGAAFGGGGGGGGRGGADDSTFYSNPGQMVTRRSARGAEVAMVSPAGTVFLRGTQYSRDYLATPPRDFLDEVAMADGKRTRKYEAPADVAESLVGMVDEAGAQLLVTRESPTQVPDSYLRAGTALTKLTANADRTPAFTALVRKRIVVTRADGISFVVRVTLPADYREGTRLPGMFWLYPYEYTSQAEYDRTLRTENVRRFPSSGARSIEFLATQGYAVANFDPPIIGEAGRMNDNYLSDLRMNLYAVIDALDKAAIIDRTRLGIGGHSYGGFSTVNALAHTPFFKAGIAGDGMYNRTLTPTGFQSERRDLWEGQKTYLDMSPMLYADKIQGALLLYHSLEDQNVGTNLISSQRMMQALRSEGKVGALFMYPYEDHGPVARENVLDQWARWTAWLDLHVKHAPARAGIM
ncbi:MAG: prolyl oligopeptidase family serine peptidase, partial [Gemmatimonadetes bacterium]|nr:prolyl oligopeptidase family serine peptidase [Gemmatimonadota bacterium]